MERPRTPLAGPPTPLMALPRLGAELGFDDGALWVKRDDLTALAGGGNKARKLEYLVADALAAGADVLVTGGAAQSNHVRMTAAAAHLVGLPCIGVLGGPPAPLDEGNLLLDAVLGLEVVWVGAYEAVAIEERLAEVVAVEEAAGRRPYAIPLGGASPVGTLGYVRAADELAEDMPDGFVAYCASGTGGTQAGLCVGLGDASRVFGVDVGAVPELAERIAALLAPVAELTGRHRPVGEVRLDAGQVGARYGSRTDACREAIDLAARHEGLLLDPVYTGKAMAALVADRRAGRLAPDQVTVFVHTGGLPALFTGRYRAWLQEWPATASS